MDHFARLLTLRREVMTELFGSEPRDYEALVNELFGPEAKDEKR